MELVLDNIMKIKEIRDEISLLEKARKSLATPLVSDQSLIPVVYNIFCEKVKESSCEWKEKKTDSRRMFIFIALCLFSPESFAGKRLCRKLRNNLAKILGETAHSVISKNKSEAIGYYALYVDFKKAAEALLKAIIEEMRTKGLVK